MSNVHTLTTTKKQQQQCKKILLSETEQTNADSDSEQIIIPARHFDAIIQNKDENFKRCLDDAIILSAKAKAESEKVTIYQMALEKEKREKEQIRNEKMVLEKELTAYKSKVKSSPEIDTMMKKMKSNTDTLIENKQALVEEHYKKNYADEIENLKKSLGL